MKKVDLWSNDPTTAQCEEMKKSAFDLLQQMRGCPEGVVTVQEALEAWRDVDCSAFGNL